MEKLCYWQESVAGRLVTRGKLPSCITQADIETVRAVAPYSEKGATIFCRFGCHVLHAVKQDDQVAFQIKEKEKN